ncbi:hypothetical protein VTN31DRAFT_1114 [Thermomyces dupontii]|uniref:uncharacterized protein n=1 Tax=Talaromyces thermophilus TaxID=28565 RepID=UPI00374497BF
MTLCSWSILCMNVPAPNESLLRIYIRKLYLTALALLGPEFIFQIALTQWESARQSVKDFHECGYTDWTMKHAFYADMGGFVLKTKDWVPFPVNAKQLHYLVTEGYVDFPQLTTRDIADRNKVDSMLRFITLCQTLWFVVNIAAREYQDLAITTAELTTAAFIVCTVATMYCWAHKPADIETAIVIESHATIAQILLEAGDRAKKPYSRTPLDFVSRKEWPWSLYWSNWVNILRNMGLDVVQLERPIVRFENTAIPEPSPAGFRACLILTSIYAAIFVCAWNYSFPTRAEQILWRIESLVVFGCLAAFWAVGKYAFEIYPELKGKRRLSGSEGEQDEKASNQNQEPTTGKRHKSRLERIADSVRNNSVGKDPELTVPLKAILPMYVAGFLYCQARAYIFIEDIIELRSLPKSAYRTVDWSSMLPHI